MEKKKLIFKVQNRIEKIILVSFIFVIINSNIFAQQATLFPDATWLQDVHWSGTIYAGIPAPIMPSVQAHLNGQEYMFHLKSDVEKARPLIEALHAQGKKYWVNLDGGVIEGSVDSILNDNQGISDPNFGAFHSLEGNLFYLGESVIRNINSSDWRNFLISSIKRAIDAGADGSQHDGGATSIYNSFDDEEVEAFTQYIENNGIVTGDWNPDYMNFREYLLFKGKTDDNVFDNDSDPENIKDLVKYWYDFKAVNTLRSWQLLKDSCSAYAQSLGKEYTIALNAGSAVGTRFGHTYLASDYAIGEFFDWGNLFPYNGLLAAKSKTFEAFGKRFISWSIPTLEDIEESNPYDNYPADIQKGADMHLAATLYASGGLPQLKYPVENSYPAYLLAQVNRELLNSVSSAGEIGVVMSHAQTLEDIRGYEGLVSVLQDINRSFKVIFFKSNRLELADDVSQFDLSKFKVIFLPEVFYLTDNQRTQLLTYMNNGGIVVAVRGNVEYTGWVDENGYNQSNSTWESLANETSSKIKTYGQGKFVNIAHNILEDGYPLVSYGFDYSRFKYSSDSEEALLANSVKDTISYWLDQVLPKKDVYSSELPNHFRVFKYQDTLSHKYVYHLLSDSVEIPSRSAIPVSPFTLELSVANSSYNKEMKAKFYSVDNPYGTIIGEGLNVNETTGRVSINLPEFERWGFVELIESGDQSNIEVSNLLINGSETPYRLPSNSDIVASWESLNNPSGKYQIEVWTNLDEIGNPIVNYSSTEMPTIPNTKFSNANKVFAKIFNTNDNSYSIPAEQLSDSTVYYMRLRAIELTDTSEWLQQFFYRNARPGIPQGPRLFTSHQNLWYHLSEDPMAPPDTNKTVVYSIQKGSDNKGRYGGDYELDTLWYGVKVYTDSLTGKLGNTSSNLYEIGNQFNKRFGPFEGGDDLIDTLLLSLSDYEDYGIYFKPYAIDNIDTSDGGELFGFYLDSQNNPPNNFNLVAPQHNSYTQNQIPFSWTNNGDPDPFMADKNKISAVEIMFDTTTAFNSAAFVSYAKDRTGSDFDKDTITIELPTNFFSVEGLLNYEKVFWKVKMWDYDRDESEGGGEGQLYTESSDVFTLYIGVQPNKPNAPNLLEPNNFATSTNINPVLMWNQVQDAEYYNIEITQDSTFTNGIFNITSNFNSKPLSGLENDKKYFWRVKAINGGVESIWSEVWSFTTIVALPEEILLLQPLNESIVSGDSVKFVWSKSEFKPTKYLFEYSTDSLFSNSIIDSSITDTNTTLVNDIENSQYWWRVKAKNNAGWGPFGDKYSFTMLLTNLIYDGTLPTKYNLSQNYPNPFNPSTTINFALPQASYVELMIFNVLGELVRKELNQILAPGNYKINIELSDLPSGIYLYKLHTKNFTQIKKMILVK